MHNYVCNAADKMTSTLITDKYNLAKGNYTICQSSSMSLHQNETKLDPSVYSSELFPNNFTVFRKDRDSHGGGVCIAANNKIQANQCHDLKNSSETLWVKLITSDHQPLYILFLLSSTG